MPEKTFIVKFDTEKTDQEVMGIMAAIMPDLHRMAGSKNLVKVYEPKEAAQRVIDRMLEINRQERPKY